MRDGDRATEPELVGAQALREWITGEPRAYSRVFVVESAALAADVYAVAGADDAVLLPTGTAPSSAPAVTVHYSGALGDIGDELFLGERGVELQDYVAAAFVQIVGPTAVCLVDTSSWTAFLDDAELARRTGVFPSALLDPRVLLAGRSAIVNPDELATPTALRLCSDGTVSVGVRGEVIGRVDELRSVLALPLPRSAALRGVAAPVALAADLGDRDAIDRFLAATDLLKMLGAADGSARIAGFGWSLFDDGRADAEPSAADAFLIDTADGVVLADVTTRRRRLLSRSTAEVVAVVQTSSTPQRAAERVARRFAIGATEASVLCREAVSALDVSLGRRAARSRQTTGATR